MNTNEVLNQQSNLFEVGDQDFEARVLRSPQPVIVDFTAEWCPPCKALAPVYARLSEEFRGKLRFARFDMDENQRVSAYLGVQAAPTVILFHNGQELERVIGPHPGRLKGLIERVLAENGLN